LTMPISTDLVARLALATLIGSLIGLNRNSHGKPAGLRTHALVALGSALIILVAGDLEGAEGSHIADAQSRAIQGLITGVGFLGAPVTTIERQPADRVCPLPEVAKRLPLDQIEQLLIRKGLTALFEMRCGCWSWHK